MPTRTKLALTTLAATIILSFTTATATAGRLSTTNTRFRLTWNELRMADATGGSLQQTCRVTLEGSFHSATIRKTAGALAGAVTRGIVDSNNCRGTLEQHHVTILQESLPWHLTYESFQGTLPNITSLTFLLGRYAYQISAAIIGITNRCLYLDGGNPEENLAGSIARNTTTGALTGDNPLEGRRSRLLTASPFPEQCPAFARLEGSGQLFLLGNTTRLSITLI